MDITNRFTLKSGYKCCMILTHIGWCVYISYHNKNKLPMISDRFLYE